jgi:hypothetical protein
LPASPLRVRTAFAGHHERATTITKHILIFLVTAIAAAGALTLTGSASAGRWIPGTPYMITKDDATSFLEKGFDHAYCAGVPRFGHRGSFPNEEFLVFDCDISRRSSGINCFDTRFRGVKGSRPGYFRLRLVHLGDCL